MSTPQLGVSRVCPIKNIGNFDTIYDDWLFFSCYYTKEGQILRQHPKFHNFWLFRLEEVRHARELLRKCGHNFDADLHLSA